MIKKINKWVDKKEVLMIIGEIIKLSILLVGAYFIYKFNADISIDKSIKNLNDFRN